MAFKKGQSGNPKGRKPGATIKPHISKYWTQAQVAEFYKSLFERAKSSDRIAVFVGEQLSGKAQQAIDLTSGGKPFLIADDD